MSVEISSQLSNELSALTRQHMQTLQHSSSTKSHTQQADVPMLQSLPNSTSAYASSGTARSNRSTADTSTSRQSTINPHSFTRPKLSALTQSLSTFSRHDFREAALKFMLDMKEEIAGLSTELVHEAERSLQDDPNSVDENDYNLVVQLKQLSTGFDVGVKSIESMKQLELEQERQRLKALGKSVAHLHSPRGKAKAEVTKRHQNVYSQLTYAELNRLAAIQAELEEKKRAEVGDDDDEENAAAPSDKPMALSAFMYRKQLEERKKNYEAFMLQKQRQHEAAARKEAAEKKRAELEAKRAAALEAEQSEATARAWKEEEKRLMLEIEKQRQADEAAAKEREAAERAAEREAIEERKRREELRQQQRYEEEQRQRVVAEQRKREEEATRLQEELRQRDAAEKEAQRVAVSLRETMQQLEKDAEMLAQTKKKQSEQAEAEQEARRQQLQQELAEAQAQLERDEEQKAMEQQLTDNDELSASTAGDQQSSTGKLAPGGKELTARERAKLKAMKFAAEKETTSNNVNKLNHAKLVQSVYRR